MSGTFFLDNELFIAIFRFVMPRPKRKCVGGIVYHVVNRANGRLGRFKRRADFEAFERVLAEGLWRVPIHIGGCARSMPGSIRTEGGKCEPR